MRDMAGNLLRGLFKHRDSGHDLARRAIAALECIALHESLLHGMERAIVLQALNRGDFVSLMSHRQRQAGERTPAVDMDGACAALALIAAFLSAAETEMLAQSVEKSAARIEMERVRFSVDT